MLRDEKHKRRLLLLMLIGLGLLSRVAVIWRFHGELLIDRDAYLSIAEQIAEGHGFSNAQTGQPTAFRPPLYPYLLAAFGSVVGWRVAVAVVNLAAGALTVAGTFWLGRRLLPLWGASIAAMLVAVDPLLVRYASQPMTESVCAATVVLFLLLAVGKRNVPQRPEPEADKIEASENPPAASAEGDRNIPPEEDRGDTRSTPLRTIQRRISSSWISLQIDRAPRLRDFLTGVMFGLSALCRPTILAAAPLFLAWGGWDRWNRRHQLASGSPMRRWTWIILGAGLVLSAWAGRNALVFGSPIIATTHGGYTLLLGNNPVYYEEVVAEPAGTVWEEESLVQWQRSLETAMQQADPPVVTEPERDRWMFRRAVANIQNQPLMFLRACWHRCQRFWGLAPMGPAAEQVPLWLTWSTAGFYLVLLLSALVGLLRLRGKEWRRWMPLLLVMLAFWLVHLLFWTDARMRAPVAPVLVLLALRGWDAVRSPRAP